jgi:hypothetical protein
VVDPLRMALVDLWFLSHRVTLVLTQALTQVTANMCVHWGGAHVEQMGQFLTMKKSLFDTVSGLFFIFGCIDGLENQANFASNLLTSVGVVSFRLSHPPFE